MPGTPGAAAASSTDATNQLTGPVTPASLTATASSGPTATASSGPTATASSGPTATASSGPTATASSGPTPTAAVIHRRRRPRYGQRPSGRPPGQGAGPYRLAEPPVARRTPTGWLGDEEVSDLTSAMVLADLLAADLPAEGPPTPGGPAASAAARRRAEEQPPNARQLQETVAQLEHALAVRVRVEQAIGVLAERHRLRPRQAFELLEVRRAGTRQAGARGRGRGRGERQQSADAPARGTGQAASCPPPGPDAPAPASGRLTSLRSAARPS